MYVPLKYNKVDKKLLFDPNNALFEQTISFNIY